jgi:hypothetical protein
LTFLPEDEPARGVVAREVARTLFAIATAGGDRGGMLVATIDGLDAARHPLAPVLVAAGFLRRPTGLQASPPRMQPAPTA